VKAAAGGQGGGSWRVAVAQQGGQLRTGPCVSTRLQATPASCMMGPAVVLQVLWARLGPA